MGKVTVEGVVFDPAIWNKVSEERFIEINEIHFMRRFAKPDRIRILKEAYGLINPSPKSKETKVKKAKA